MYLEIAKIYNLNHKDLNNEQEITIKGWVRSNRNSKKIGFLDIHDGSYLKCLQVVYKIENKEWEKLISITTGSAVILTGIIVANNNQIFELNLIRLDYLNLASVSYPIQKKAHSYEFLRDHAFLRPRTDTFFAIFKIRNQITSAIHQFFQNNNFIYLNSPLITANDAEGAGENFIVTTTTHDRYEEDFFGKKASLTVSGQLNAEAYAQAFKKVYTFGPTFRAENSNTSRHAAEFWMVEPEVAFASLEDNIRLAKNLIVYLANNLLQTCKLELEFLDKKLTNEVTIHQNLFSKLELIANESNYKTITYTEVIELLKAAQNFGHKFEFNNIEWGIDLQSEHEKYICEVVMKAPTFVINYPQAIKAFYMKLNDSNNKESKTVAAMDLLVPGIGELIGGSVREDNYQQLLKNKENFQITNNDLDWYFNIRNYGYAPSAGFGLGLERLIMFVTGMTNIRDVIAFPRTPNNLMF